MLVALATFAAAAALVIVFPGPDTLVVLRSVVRGGAVAARPRPPAS